MIFNKKTTAKHQVLLVIKAQEGGGGDLGCGENFRNEAKSRGGEGGKRGAAEISPQ